MLRLSLNPPLAFPKTTSTYRTRRYFHGLVFRGKRGKNLAGLSSCLVGLHSCPQSDGKQEWPSSRFARICALTRRPPRTLKRPPRRSHAPPAQGTTQIRLLS